MHRQKMHRSASTIEGRTRGPGPSTRVATSQAASATSARCCSRRDKGSKTSRSTTISQGSGSPWWSCGTARDALTKGTAPDPVGAQVADEQPQGRPHADPQGLRALAGPPGRPRALERAGPSWVGIAAEPKIWYPIIEPIGPQTMNTANLAPLHLASDLDHADLLEAARDYVEAAKAPNTRRAYRTQWATFSTWCEAHDQEPLPAAPATLALYLADRARLGRKVASLGLALSAIRATHRDAGLADPAAVPEVRTVWEGIRRTHGTAQRRATPLTATAIRAVVASFPSDALRFVRDRAMILLGFAGAFRRSELVALDVTDVAFDPVRGVVVTVRRSKTDQAGAGADVAIPFASLVEVCAVRTLRRWIDATQLTTGPLFRSVDRHGNVGQRLDGRDVARIVKGAAARAGIEASLVSGHSLRAGLATTAACAGKSDRTIMAQGRWRSRTMLDRYVRTADAWRDNAADGLL